MDLFLLLKAVILGIVEGLTEFIPVSSTGHLILFQNWLDFTGKKANAFIIFIQVGAILAVLWLYRKRFVTLVCHWRRVPEARRLIVNLFWGILPAVIVGLPTEKWIEAHFFRPLPVSLALVFGGIAILMVERWRKQPSVEAVDHVSWQKALGIGMVQVLSILFPGVSRSGATIMGGLALGLSRTAATEFSFFMAIPAMLGASALKLIGAHKIITSCDLPFFGVGLIVSFFVALMVIRRLLTYVSHHSFAPFAWYRILFGAVLLALYWSSPGGF